MASLPPCRNSLNQHIHRVNYQVAFWKRALEAAPEIPDPEGHVWIEVDGQLEPLWFDGPLLPQQLADVAEADTSDSDDSDDDFDED